MVNLMLFKCFISYSLCRLVEFFHHRISIERMILCADGIWAAVFRFVLVYRNL